VKEESRSISRFYGPKNLKSGINKMGEISGRTWLVMKVVNCRLAKI
jgi:hypothetical protein